MVTFIALYRGDSVASAKLLALTADPQLVRKFAGRMLDAPGEGESDAVLAEVEQGRRQALRLVRREAESRSGRPLP